RYQSFDQGRFRDNRSRDNTFIDFQGGSSHQGGWRDQDQGYYYQGNNRGQGYGPGYQGQRFEGNSSGRSNGARWDPRKQQYEVDQGRNQSWFEGRQEYGSGSFGGNENR